MRLLNDRLSENYLIIRVTYCLKGASKPKHTRANAHRERMSTSRARSLQNNPMLYYIWTDADFVFLFVSGSVHGTLVRGDTIDLSSIILFLGHLLSTHTPHSFRSFSAQTRTDSVLFRNAYVLIEHAKKKKTKTNRRRVFVLFSKLSAPHRLIWKT